VRIIVGQGEAAAVGWLQKVHLTAEQDFFLTVRSDVGVILVCGPVDHPGLALLVIAVALPKQHRSHWLSVAVDQGYLGPFYQRAGRGFVRREGHGLAPGEAVREAHVFHDALVFLPLHKPSRGLKTPVEIICKSEMVRGPRETLGIPTTPLRRSLRSSAGTVRSTSAPRAEL
jgi:hypothetical protein